MSRYLFHLFDDNQTLDSEGKVLSDLKAARALAVDAARGIMADEIRTRGQLDLSHWIEIEDENGDMTIVTFRDAVKLTDSSHPSLSGSS